MNSPPDSLAPRQDRSRATALRLLTATVAILDESGLEGAVIPRIAEAAGVAPASIYRRFGDKNALLRAAFLHMLEQSNAANQATLAALLHGETLAATARKLVGMLFDQYRRHPQLLRALSRFVDSDTDQAFVHQVRTLLAAHVDQVVAVLLRHRGEFAGAAPAATLRMLVLGAGCAIEVFTLDPQSVWHVAPAVSESELVEHLVHGFVAHMHGAEATRMPA